MEERLIEEVRMHRELYDTKHPAYMRSKLKNRIWAEIGKLLHFPHGEEAKTLWLKLRGSYRDAKRRQRRCAISGGAVDRPWRYQQQMSFLDPFMISGPKEENADKSEEMDENINDHVDHLVCVPNFEDFEDTGEEGRDLPSTTQTLTPDDTRLNPPGDSKADELFDVFKKLLESRESRARERQADKRQMTENLDNPLYNFFLSMYQLTNAMPPEYQRGVRNDLYRSVSAAEEKIFKMNSVGRASETRSREENS